MNSRKLMFFTLLILAFSMGSAFAAQEFTVTPTVLPAGAYVNLGGDNDDDQYFWQVIYLKFPASADGSDADAGDITIDLPDDVNVADANNDGGVVNDIALSFVVDDQGTGGTTDDLQFTVGAGTTSSQIIIDADDVAAATYTDGDELWIMFPIETSTTPDAGPHEYTVDFAGDLETDGVPESGDDDFTDPAVTFTASEGNIGLLTFEDILTGDHATTKYGEKYPDPAASTITAGLPDFIKDQAGTEFRVTSSIIGDWNDVTYPVENRVFEDAGDDSNDTYYKLWASQQDDLAFIEPSDAGVQPVVNFSTGIEYTNFEGQRFSDAYAVSGLPEGDWYFYITSSVTSGWILGKSGMLTVTHQPWVKLVGWDFNDDGVYDEDDTATGDYKSGYSDDNDVTLDTGSFKNYDNSIDDETWLSSITDIDFYVKANDFDDNAAVTVFYSTTADLDSADVRVSGTAPNLVVEGLDNQGGTATLLTDGLYDDDKDPYLEFNWDLGIKPDGSFLPANTYTVYVVACDGKNYDISAVQGHSSSNLSLNLVHSPGLVLDTLQEYSVDPSEPDVLIDLSETKVVMLSWGKNLGIEGDMDIDDEAKISFYIHEDVDDDADFDADEPSSLTSDPNTTQIVSGLSEQLESQDQSYYEWDIEEFSRNTGWVPTDRAIHHLYAVITEDKSDGVSRVVALGDDGLLHAGEDLSANYGNIRFINDPYVRIENPPTKGATLTPEEIYRFDIDAFDIDDNGSIGVYVVKEGVTFNDQAGNPLPEPPMQTYVGGLGGLYQGIMTTSTTGGSTWMLTSDDGDPDNHVNIAYPLENSAEYFDFQMRLPSENGGNRYSTNIATAGDNLTDGDYYVYVGVDDGNWQTQTTVPLDDDISAVANVGDWVTSDAGASGIITAINAAGPDFDVILNTAATFDDTDKVDIGRVFVAEQTFIDGTVAGVAVNDFSAAPIKLYRAPGKLTVSEKDKESPQNNIMLSPSKINVSAGDTTEVVLSIADQATDDIDLVDIYVAVEKDYFTPVMQSGAPFVRETSAATLVANRVIDDTANNRWILNATVYDGGGAIDFDDEDSGTDVASFKILNNGTLNDESAETSVYIVNEPSSGWATSYQSVGVKRSFAANAMQVNVQPRPILRGNAHLDGRATSDAYVTFELRKPGSYFSTDDALFLAQNDADPNTDGIQYTLNTDGEFTLKLVPSGEWDLVVKYPRYLSESKSISIYDGLDTLMVDYGVLRGGDAGGFEDSLGYDLPNNRVNSTDITKINDAYLKTPSDPDWDSTKAYKYADINEDGEVEIEDLRMATKVYNSGSGDIDGAQPVFDKEAVRPQATNIDAMVEILNVPDKLTAGQTYTVQVALRNAGDVTGYFVYLDYNVDTFDFKGIAKGDFIDAASYSFPVVEDGKAGLANSVYGDYSFAGDGLLAEARFTAKVDGSFDSSMLNISRASLVDSYSMRDNIVVEQPVSVDAKTPMEFSLEQNFPNPFNPTTTISFTIPSDNLVTLKIYDILGRHVKTLVSSHYSAGNYNVVWDARDNSGNMVSAGVYFYNIQAGNFHTTKRMLLLK